MGHMVAAAAGSDVRTHARARHVSHKIAIRAAARLVPEIRIRVLENMLDVLLSWGHKGTRVLECSGSMLAQLKESSVCSLHVL